MVRCQMSRFAWRAGCEIVLRGLQSRTHRRGRRRYCQVIGDAAHDVPAGLTVTGKEHAEKASRDVKAGDKGSEARPRQAARRQ